MSDFDFLANLHEVNPKAHHEYHAEAVEDYIATLPPDRAERMRKFQQGIVNEMNDCSTLEERNQRMNELFWNQTAAFTKAFDTVGQYLKKNR